MSTFHTSSLYRGNATPRLNRFKLATDRVGLARPKQNNIITASTSYDGDSPIIDVPAGGKLVKRKPTSLTKRSKNNALSPVQFQPSTPVLQARPLPRVLLIHTGGTLGMDPDRSFETDTEGHRILKAGTGGEYTKANQLRPGNLLNNLLDRVPELTTLAQIDLHVVFNL